MMWEGIPIKFISESKDFQLETKCFTYSYYHQKNIYNSVHVKSYFIPTWNLSLWISPCKPLLFLTPEVLQYWNGPKRRKIYKYSLNMLDLVFRYESPKVVIIENKGLGMLRLVLHTICLSFLFLYELMYCRGYQTTIEAQSSITSKVKGFSL